MRITKVSLLDIQSWAGENELELSPASLNILKAPSETGKSTSTRFLMKFCQDLPDYTDIIRSGCESGGMIFEYEDGSKLLMLMEKHGRMLGYLDSDGDIIESFSNDQINEQVLQRYGIIFDERNSMITNVFSRDLPLLFVNTTETFNGSMLSRVLVNKDVERALENLKLQEESIVNSLKYHGIKKDQISKMCSQIEYKDVDKLETAKRDIKVLLPIAKSFQTIYESYTRYLKASGEIKIKHDVGMASEEIRKFTEIVDCVEQLNTKKQKVEQCKVQLAECKSVPITILQIEKYIKINTFFDNLQKKIEFIQNLKQEIELSSESIESAKRRVTSLQQELKVCPLCGGIFNNESCNHTN